MCFRCRQLNTGPFVDLMKRIEALSATECACESLLPITYFLGDFLHQMPDSMIVDLLVIKTRIRWPDSAHIKECAEVLCKVQSDT
jgi:hypothetical protein